MIQARAPFEPLSACFAVAFTSFLQCEKPSRTASAFPSGLLEGANLKILPLAISNVLDFLPGPIARMTFHKNDLDFARSGCVMKVHGTSARLTPNRLARR